MKRLLFLAVILAGASLLLSGPAPAQGKPEKARKPAAANVEASGAALWEHLQKADYAKKWKMWPGKTAFYKGTEPHGVLLTTYINGPALRAIEGKQGKMPDGAIIVKENYSSSKKLMAYTIMYKVKSYNPEGGDWFWVKYLPDGKVDGEGKMEGCLKCHTMVKGNDYLFAGPIK